MPRVGELSHLFRKSFWFLKINRRSTNGVGFTSGASGEKVVLELWSQLIKRLIDNRVPKCDVTKILFLEYFNFGLKF